MRASKAPCGWHKYFEEARQNPSPFPVVSVDITTFLNMEKRIKIFIVATCPIRTQPTLEVVISKDYPLIFHNRENRNGGFLNDILNHHFCMQNAQEFYTHLLFRKQDQSSSSNDYYDIDDKEEMEL